MKEIQNDIYLTKVISVGISQSLNKWIAFLREMINQRVDVIISIAHLREIFNCPYTKHWKQKFRITFSSKTNSRFFFNLTFLYKSHIENFLSSQDPPF